MLPTNLLATKLLATNLLWLLNSACAPYMEPLIVALQMLVGEDYNAPLEVVEVAKDVHKRIEEKREQKINFCS
jgi:hypothetical protein